MILFDIATALMTQSWNTNSMDLGPVLQVFHSKRHLATQVIVLLIAGYRWLGTVTRVTKMSHIMSHSNLMTHPNMYNYLDISIVNDIFFFSQIQTH